MSLVGANVVGNLVRAGAVDWLLRGGFGGWHWIGREQVTTHPTARLNLSIPAKSIKG